MFITDNIIGTTLLSNIIFKSNTSNPPLIQAMMLNPSIKMEIKEWLEEVNMVIIVLIYFDSISNIPVSMKIQEFRYSEWQKYDRIVLRFDSVEDYNLFKLTWG